MFRSDGAGNYTALQTSAGTLKVVGADGALYGVGIGSVYGGVFRMDNAGNYSVVHAFNGTDGGDPRDLALGSDGALYGVTYYGGLGYGTVFRIDSAGNHTLLHSFDGSDSGGSLS